MANVQYDLLSINGVAIPDVKKGSLTIAPNPKYVEVECEEGNKIIDIINSTMVKGSVEFSGLMQSELQTIYAATSLVSVMEIYNPMTGQVKRFSALVLIGDMTKIIHDAGANAWSFGFEFEEIDNAPEED